MFRKYLNSSTEARRKLFLAILRQISSIDSYIIHICWNLQNKLLHRLSIAYSWFSIAVSLSCLSLILREPYMPELRHTSKMEGSEAFESLGSNLTFFFFQGICMWESGLNAAVAIKRCCESW